MDNLIIMNDENCFWTGTNWNFEYPEAMLYTNKREAFASLKKIEKKENARVIIDYGYVTEGIIGS